MPASERYPTNVVHGLYVDAEDGSAALDLICDCATSQSAAEAPL
jgi:hypothetical protein